MRKTKGLTRPRKGEDWVVVLINDFVVSDVVQVREKLDKEIVSRYMVVLASDPNAMPPITLARIPVADADGSTLLHLVDGFHRVAAAKQIGITQMKAFVIDVGSINEALWRACKANVTHGLHMSARHIRKGFRAFINAGLNVRDNGTLLSYADIKASFCCVKSRQTICNWMNADFPDTAKAMSENAPTLQSEKDEGIEINVRNLIQTIDRVECKIKALSKHKQANLLYARIEAMVENIKSQDDYQQHLSELDALDF